MVYLHMTLPTEKLAAAFAQTTWFNDLSAADQQLVLQRSELRSQGGGTVVVRKGEAVDAWIGVVEGLVKITAVSPQGKTVTFTGVPPGGWFGEGSLIKNEPRKYDIVALRDSVIGWVPKVVFDHLMEHSITFNRFLLMQLNERLGQFIATVEYDRLLDPDARVARCIAGLFNPVLYPSSSKRLDISQEEIGFLSGVSRQRVNQALKVLEDAGLLRVAYGAIEILNLERLRSYGS
jgi:CRP/FNR family transcriptional regulator, cyclic AMP receptor protein